MKRLLAILLSVTLIFLFVGCAGDKISSDENTDVGIVTETAQEWKKFLKEYESWVDTYISVLEKYSKNPTDSSVSMDYMNMTKDMSKWQTKADEFTKELSAASAQELAEYSKELARIAAKITEAM